MAARAPHAWRRCGGEGKDADLLSPSYPRPLHIPGPLPNITGIVVADRDESLSHPRPPPPCGPKSVGDPSGTAQGLGGAGACRAVAGAATKSNRCELARNCEDEQENQPSHPISKACDGLNAAVESHHDTAWLVLDKLANFLNAAQPFQCPTGVGPPAGALPQALHGEGSAGGEGFAGPWPVLKGGGAGPRRAADPPGREPALGGFGGATGGCRGKPPQAGGGDGCVSI